MSLNVGVLQKKTNDRNMKRNSDGQQFQLSFHNHQYQQNKQLPITSSH
jgi:hypothetical protein